MTSPLLSPPCTPNTGAMKRSNRVPCADGTPTAHPATTVSAVAAPVAASGTAVCPAIARLSSTIAMAVTKAAACVKCHSRMNDLGYEIVGGTPEQMAAMIQDEMKRWGPIVKASGAKVD